MFKEFTSPLSAQDRALLISRDWRYLRERAIPIVLFIFIYWSYPLPAVAAVLFGFFTPVIIMFIVIITVLNHNNLIVTGNRFLRVL
jgi:hypothetical protein